MFAPFTKLFDGGPPPDGAAPQTKPRTVSTVSTNSETSVGSAASAGAAHGADAEAATPASVDSGSSRRWFSFGSSKDEAVAAASAAVSGTSPPNASGGNAGNVGAGLRSPSTASTASSSVPAGTAVRPGGDSAEGMLIDVGDGSHGGTHVTLRSTAGAIEAAFPQPQQQEQPRPLRTLPPPSVAFVDEHGDDPPHDGSGGGGDGFERFPVRYLGWLEVGKGKGQLSPALAMLRLSQVESAGTRAVLLVSTWGIRVIDETTREPVIERPIQKIASCLSSDNKEVIAIVATSEADGSKHACFVFRAGKHTHRITEATGRAFTQAYEKKVASGGVTPEAARRARAVSAPAPSFAAADKQRSATAPPQLSGPKGGVGGVSGGQSQGGPGEAECCGRSDCPALQLRQLRSQLQSLSTEDARRVITELIETQLSIAERDVLFRGAKRSSAHFDAVPSAEDEYKSMLVLVEGVFERRFVTHRQQMQQQQLMAIGENDEEDKSSKIASSISTLKKQWATSLESLMGKVERARSNRLSLVRTDEEGPLYPRGSGSLQPAVKEGDSDSVNEGGRSSPGPSSTPRDSVTSIGSTSSTKDGARRSWRRAIFKSVLLNQVEREVEEARAHGDDGAPQLTAPSSPLPPGIDLDGDDGDGTQLLSPSVASPGTHSHHAAMQSASTNALDEFDPIAKTLGSASLDGSAHHLAVPDTGKPRKSSEELLLLWRRAASLTAEEGSVDPEEARLEEVWKKRLGENDEAQLAAFITSMGIGDKKGASGDTASVQSLPGSAANGAGGSGGVGGDSDAGGHHTPAGHHGHTAHHGGKRHKQRKRLTAEDLARLMSEGVPRKYRTRAWRLIVSCRNPSGKMSIPDISYSALLVESSPHEPQIRQDIGRTYPDHPLFAQKDGEGQTALFNIMKAYSVLDPEVGYCQGLTFVGGAILMHLPEEDAFWILVHLMQHLGLRDLYKPDMEALQVNLYQFSRLVYDHCPTLHRHLERCDVKPFLYAAAWFLTLFASQFPLAFAFRVLDVLLAHGRIVIFKIGITLLRDSEQRLLRREGLEEIVSFLKTELPLRPVAELVGLVWTAMQTQAVTPERLAAFENEYHIMRESMENGEDVSASMRLAAQQWAAEKQDLEARLALADRRNQQLRSKNMSLETEVLAIRDTIIADYQRLLETMRAEKEALEDAAGRAQAATRRMETQLRDTEAQLMSARMRLADSENEKNALSTRVRALQQAAADADKQTRRTQSVT